MKQIGDWGEVLNPVISNGQSAITFEMIKAKLLQETLHYTVYPKMNDVWRAFELCPIDKFKIVILGQDPYHDGSATGLAFGVESKTDIPPSLQNIQREVCRLYNASQSDFDFTLETWAEQGVLLLNSALTVVKSLPNSHVRIWKDFTKDVLQNIYGYNKNALFLALGSKAKKTLSAAMIPESNIISVPHPAKDFYKSSTNFPEKFLGSAVFVKANNYLEEKGIEQIKWI